MGGTAGEAVEFEESCFFFPLKIDPNPIRLLSSLYQRSEKRKTKEKEEKQREIRKQEIGFEIEKKMELVIID